MHIIVQKLWKTHQWATLLHWVTCSLPCMIVWYYHIILTPTYTSCLSKQFLQPPPHPLSKKQTNKKTCELFLKIYVFSIRTTDRSGKWENTEKWTLVVVFDLFIVEFVDNNKDIEWHHPYSWIGFGFIIVTFEINILSFVSFLMFLLVHYTPIARHVFLLV